MQQFKAISGQSLLDVCLNTYGSFESLIQLVLDNNVQSFNGTIYSGQIFNWNPVEDIQNIAAKYSTNNTIFFDEKFLDSIIDDSGNPVIDNSNNHII